MTEGISPSRTSVMPKRASSAATAISQAAISPTAPPIAAPLILATVGCGMLSSVCSMSESRVASARLDSCE